MFRGMRGIGWHFAFASLCALGCTDANSGSTKSTVENGDGSTSFEPVDGASDVAMVSDVMAASDGGTDAAIEPQVQVGPDPDSAVPFVDACAVDDGRITVLARASGPSLADDDSVYFGELSCVSLGKVCLPAGGPIRRVPRCGGTPEILYPGSMLIGTLLDGQSVVYALRPLSYIPSDLLPVSPEALRIDKATGSVEEISVHAAVAAATSSGVVYGNGTGIWWFPVDANEPDPAMLTSEVDVTLLTATETMVFWSDGVRVFRAAPRSTQGSEVSGFDPGATITALVAAEDRVYAYAPTTGALDGTIYEIRDSGNAVRLGTFPSTPTLWSAGQLYFSRAPDSMYASETVRADPASVNPEIVLRYTTVDSVSSGSLFWAQDGYLFTRKAIPEPSADALLAGDGPNATYPALVSSDVKDLATGPNTSFALVGLKASTPPPPGEAAIMDLGFFRLYSDPNTVVKEFTFPAGEYPTDVGFDASGNAVALIDMLGSADWLRADSSGAELGRSAANLVTEPSTWVEASLGVGASGRFAIGGYDAQLPAVEIHAPDGTLIAMVNIDAGFAVTHVRVAVRDDDHVVVAGDGTDLSPLTSFLASVNDVGAVEWVRTFTGMGISDIASAPNGDVYLAGSSKMYFDIGHGEELVQVPDRDNSVLARFDAAGTLIWVKTFEGYAPILTVRGPGGFVMAETVPLGGFADLGDPLLQGARSSDPLVARFDENGVPLSVRRWSEASIAGIGLDSSGGIVAGNWDGSIAMFSP